jgi:hypothetical protein
MYLQYFFDGIIGKTGKANNSVSIEMMKITDLRKKQSA